MDEDLARKTLTSLFESLPEAQLKKLGAKIELDRTENRFGLPHQAIISLMRPYLAAVRAPRVYTPQRILCVPFEDMFTNHDPGFKRIGFINRKSIAPFWRWLSRDLMPETLPALSDRFAAAQQAGDETATAQAASALWAQAAAALQEGLDRAEVSIAAYEALAKICGGSAIVEDFAEMTKVLTIADHVEAMKRELPHKPIALLTPDSVSTIIRHYTAVGAENPGKEMFLLLIVIGRLLQPFPILKVFRSLSRKGDDSVIRTTDLSIAGDIVISALEQDAVEAARVAQDRNSGEEEIVRKAARFAAAFKGITTDIGIRRDGEWGQRMYKSRNAVAEAVESRILNNAHNTVMSALSERHGSQIAALDAWPDENDFDSAETRASALAALYRISDQLGVRAVCQSMLDDIRKSLNDYSVPLVEALNRLPKEEHPPAFANLAVVVRLLELVANSDDADLLRRRGRAALDGTMLDY